MTNRCPGTGRPIPIRCQWHGMIIHDKTPLSLAVEAHNGEWSHYSLLQHLPLDFKGIREMN